MIYRFGPFELDTRLLELRRDGVGVPIVPRAFNALRLLIEQRDRVIGKDELIAAVWRRPIVSEETVASCINAVRRAVGDDGKRQTIVRTVSRRGFRFVMPVTAIDETSPLPGTVTQQPATVDQSSLAVLPFENLSHDLSQDRFAEAITNDVVTALWRWRTLPVIELGTATSDAEVRHEARYVLKGSTRKIGNRVRVTARLIDSETGQHFVIQQIDRTYARSFALEDDVTNEIVGTLVPKVERIEYQRLKLKRPRRLSAGSLVQSGMALLDEYTKESNLRARELFRDAIELDPSCSRAYSGIALAISRALMSGYEYFREAAADKAVEAGHRAVDLDGSDAFAHNALGMSYLWARQNGDAISAIRDAVTLNPSYGHARGSLGDILVRTGRIEEGITMMKDALRLNPNAPNIKHFNAFLARGCIVARRYQEAAHWAKKAIYLKSDLAHAYCLLAVGLGHLGLRDDARRALDRCQRVQPDFFDSAVELSPYEDPSANDHLVEGLYRAGWRD